MSPQHAKPDIKEGSAQFNELSAPAHLRDAIDIATVHKYDVHEGKVLIPHGNSVPLSSFLVELVDQGVPFNITGHRTSQHAGGPSTNQHFKFEKFSKNDIQALVSAYEEMTNIRFGLVPQYSIAVKYLDTKE